MFKKVVIANRGIVATRVARTLNDMGIGWVAVHSEVDEELPYVSEANEAYCIGAAIPRESYLNYDAILGAIKQSQCDAVHPGYGFLSEDPEFARLVTATGVCFIGPRPSDVEVMGNKIRARNRMDDAGIPVLAGDTDSVKRGAVAASGFNYYDVGRTTTHFRAVRWHPAYFLVLHQA